MGSTNFNLTSIGGVNKPPIDFSIPAGLPDIEISPPSFDISVQMGVLGFSGPGGIDVPSFDVSVQMSVVSVIGPVNIDAPSFDIITQMSVSEIWTSIQKVQADPFNIEVGLSITEINKIFNVGVSEFSLNISMSAGPIRIYLYSVFEERYALPIIRRVFTIEDSLRPVITNEFESIYLLSESPNSEFVVESSLRVSSEYEEEYLLSYDININTEVEYSLRLSVNSEIESNYLLSESPNNEFTIESSLRVSSEYEGEYQLSYDVNTVIETEYSLRPVISSEFEEEYLLSESPNNEFIVESSLRVSSEYEEEYLLSYRTRKELEAEYSLKPVISSEFESTYYIADTIRLVFVDESDLSSLDPVSTEFLVASSLIKGTSTFYSFTVLAEV